jgi:hypothetical protein
MQEHFAGLHLFWTAQSLRNHGIETSGTFRCRATRIVEELGSPAALALPIALSRVQQHGEAGTVELIRHFACEA